MAHIETFGQKIGNNNVILSIFDCWLNVYMLNLPAKYIQNIVVYKMNLQQSLQTIMILEKNLFKDVGKIHWCARHRFDIENPQILIVWRAFYIIEGQ